MFTCSYISNYDTENDVKWTRSDIMAAGVHSLNKEKFYEAINLYISGQASQVKAAKVAGCSVPTFLKYANKIYGGEELPDNLWGKKND